MGISTNRRRSLAELGNGLELASDLLREYGDLADAIAMQRALDARAARDSPGEAKWLRAFDRIRAMLIYTGDQSRQLLN